MTTFDFKQFRITFDEDIMPLTVDAVLFGSWVDSNGRKRIIDVGCGTGILSLIQAQRNPSVDILALDISKKASLQCESNAKSSPFSLRVNVQHGDFFAINNIGYADMIMVNPPFFSTGNTKSNPYLAQSRHTTQFNSDAFMARAHELTSPDGQLCMLSTREDRISWEKRARESNWYLKKIAITGIRKELPKRVFFQWTKRKYDREVKETFVQLPTTHGPGNENYYSLIKDLYVRTKK